jgi:hypothetical protein
MISTGISHRHARARAMPFLALACAPLVLGGCVTAKKYRLAKDDTPPAQPLGWSNSTPPAELTLRSLIVIGGPGSWKREARWDEYVMQVSNHGGQPMVIGSAALTDLQGTPQFPGSDPWQLEKLSYTNWDKYGRTGLNLLAGAGMVTLYFGASAAVATSSLMAGGGTAAAAGGAATALAIIPVVAVVDILVVASMNHYNKEHVQQEFNRRRLVLPLTVAPGAIASGSLFFPMTPGPQRLTLQGQAGDTPLELVLELKPLAGLHLKPEAKK